MDQQLDERVASDMAKVRDTAHDLAAETEKTVQDGIDQSKPFLGKSRERADAAIDGASDLAHKASAPVVHAVDAIHAAARDVGQAATTVYQQGSQAGGSVSRYTAEQPLTALAIAGAIGYGLAYLIHRQ